MARIFITGSSDGLGLMAGRLLSDQGHEVVLHARNQARADETKQAFTDVAEVLVGDVATIAAMRDLAAQANRHGRFDAVIHNVGLGFHEPDRVVTADGLSQLWAVNVLAPYVLTALMHRPARLVYLSSGMHRGGHADLSDAQWDKRRWNGVQAYSDTKLHDLMLAFAVARRWPDVITNAVHPGWVATKMGGAGASDDLDQGAVTQAWLAVSDDPQAQETGGYWFHQQHAAVNAVAKEVAAQERLIGYCREKSGIALP
jgi:NAD(P)-dependent dehydrogenase (short-subunit alcohol dehydrogenase family)